MPPAQFFDNNFFGMNLGYHPSQDNTMDAYLGGDGQPIAGPSKFQDWYLQPTPEGHASRFEYQGCSLLNQVGHQFADPHALRAGHAHNNFVNGVIVDALNHHEQTINTPAECVDDLVPFPITPTHQTVNHSPSSTAGTHTTSAYERSPAGSSSASQWSGAYSPPSVDDWNARTTDHIPSTVTTTIESNAWQCFEQQNTAETNGMSIPQTVPGVPPNTDFPSPIAPSHGPQRSKGAKGKGKAAQRAKGMRKYAHAEPLPQGVDSSWEQTKDRFVCEMLEEYYFRPAGRFINPETAFASLTKFIKEDLHRSPLAAQAATAKAEKKESRMYEQYLIHILKELRRSGKGELRNEVFMYKQVLQELSSELAPTNARHVLKEGHPLNKESGEVGNPSGKVKHREAERARRTTIRNLQDQISLYFLVPGHKKISVGELLLFVVVYLRIGKHAFPGLVQGLYPDNERED